MARPRRPHSRPAWGALAACWLLVVAVALAWVAWRIPDEQPREPAPTYRGAWERYEAPPWGPDPRLPRGPVVLEGSCWPEAVGVRP